MLRLRASLALATALAAVAAQPLHAQDDGTGPWVLASVHDWVTDPSVTGVQHCGTGETTDGLLLSVHLASHVADCQGGLASASAAGGALHVVTRMTGPGLVEVTNPGGPFVAGQRYARTAQVDAYYVDVLHSSLESGVFRFTVSFDGTRDNTLTPPPAGLPGSTVTTGGWASLSWDGGGWGHDLGQVSTAGTDDFSLTHTVDVPFVGGSLAYSLELGGFARIYSAMIDPTHAYLSGQALMDLGHTFRITRVQTLTTGGDDVTATTTLQSGFFTVGASGAVVPEPATVALLAGGLAMLGLVVRRRSS